MATKVLGSYGWKFDSPIRMHRPEVSRAFVLTQYPNIHAAKQGQLGACPLQTTLSVDIYAVSKSPGAEDRRADYVSSARGGIRQI